MLISDFAIRRPIITVTAMIALVGFGLVALWKLRTDEFPDIEQPIINVTIPYPGASPDVVEREIVEPVEEALFAISGVDGAKSISSATDGLATFTMFFEYSKDINQASQDIRDAISGIRSDLPPEMKEPVLTRFDPGVEPVVSLALTSKTRSANELTTIADPGIVRELRSISGVAQVTVVGGLKREMSVQLIPAALEANQVSVAEVVAALEAQNLAAPVGQLKGATDERPIRLRGRMDRAEDFARTVITQREGRTIHLGDLARVEAGFEEPRTLALLDDQQAVGIEILKTKGYSTTEVSARILGRAAELQASLPKDVSFRVVQNAGERVRHAVTNVEEALLSGALLTVLVVFLFLNSWRSTVITGLALPVSVLSAFISVWAFGFTLNTMSLMGLSLAIGILIDDAIVVRENIVRHIQLGEDHATASRKATSEIGLAVSATTFSIIAVFVPIAFMSGVAGQWFKPFALTIASAVLVSLLVSFSLDPMLSAVWADPQLLPGHKASWLNRLLTRFSLFFERLTDRYARVVGWALDHRLIILLLAVGSFVGAVLLQGAFGGTGFVPVSDRSELSFIIETPPNSNIDYTRAKVEQIVRLTRAHAEVAYAYSTIGTPVPLRTPGVDQALVYVRLVPKAERKLSQADLGALLRTELTRIAGANVSVFTSGFGGAFKQVQLQLRGPDATRLNELAEKIKAEVEKVPGAVDVGLSTRGTKPELEVTLNRGLAGTLGITVADVAQSLRPAFAGLDSGDWVDELGETRDVMVRLIPEARSRPVDLARLPLIVRGDTAEAARKTVPLGQIAEIRQGLAPAQINHLDRQKVIDIQANLAGRSLSEVMRDIQARLPNVPLPAGYGISLGGEARDQAEVFGDIFTALGIAVLLMYLILVVQFGSFLDPIAILLSLPLSLIGVVLALLITHDSLNIMSLIGVILLMGIVAKNSILLIDFAKWAREGGMPLREALITAGKIRLRPILMTTFALIAGMVPVALGLGEGADFRAPLGRAVIGGTLTSTLLTLLVIPTVYEILDGWRTRLKNRLLRMTKRPVIVRQPLPGGDARS
ncbi:MAG: efflux RND transporter permease subunit [Myxococcaceae bacterium]